MTMARRKYTKYDKKTLNKIQNQIAEKLMIEWKNLGKKADETYLT